MPHHLLESPQFSFHGTPTNFAKVYTRPKTPLTEEGKEKSFVCAKDLNVKEENKKYIRVCVPSPLGPVISFLLFYHCKSYAPGASTLRFLAPASEDAKMMRALMGNTRRRGFFSFLRELCKCCLQSKKNWPEWMVCAFG